MSASAPVMDVASNGAGRDMHSGLYSDSSPMDGWREIHVVFCGQAQIAWLRWLRAGFRHCFVVFGSRHGWITFDPLSCWTDIRRQPVPGDFDLPAWYRAQGMITVAVSPARSVLPKPAPAGPFTCVEAVKRVLGLRDRMVLTPYQLYRRLGGDPSVAERERQYHTPQTPSRSPIQTGRPIGPART